MVDRQKTVETNQDLSPRRKFLLWLASLGFGAAVIGIRGARDGAATPTSGDLRPGRAGHDPCLNPGAPRGRAKELS